MLAIRAINTHNSSLNFFRFILAKQLRFMIINSLLGLIYIVGTYDKNNMQICR